MVLFDIEDLDGARTRAEELGVRTVWSIDLPDISGTHMHPADLRGAIVSLDSLAPFGSWRWGGPEWTERIGSGPPGQADRDHGRARRATGRGRAVGARCWAWGWTAPSSRGSRWTAPRCGSSRRTGAEGIVEIAVEVPEAVRDGRERIDVGSAAIALSTLDGG